MAKKMKKRAEGWHDPIVEALETGHIRSGKIEVEFHGRDGTLFVDGDGIGHITLMMGRCPMGTAGFPGEKCPCCEGYVSDIDVFTASGA